MIRRAMIAALVLLVVATGVLFYFFVYVPRLAHIERAVRLHCDERRNLEAFATCILQALPRPAGAPAFEVETPSPASLLEIAALTRRLLDDATSGNLSCAVELPSALAGHYVLSWITEGDRHYCALWENVAGARSGRVQKGWGTLVIAQRFEREVVFAAPHPLFDRDTERQALAVLRATGARAALIAGTHRHASSAASTCQRSLTDERRGSYSASDPSHNVGTYSAIAMGVAMHYGAHLNAPGSLDFSQSPHGWAFVEFHGMGYSSESDVCIDATGRPLNVYATTGDGEPFAAHAPATRLLAALMRAHPAWNVSSAGSGATCAKRGSGNIVGRLYRGVGTTLRNAPDEPVCIVPRSAVASSSARNFLHIEQTRCVDVDDRCRSDDAIRSADAWGAAFISAFPSADEKSR